MAKGMNPAYSGVLLTDDKDPKKRTILGRMALWESVTIKENSPVMRGVVTTSKGKYRVSLWKFKPKEDGGL